MGGLLIAALGFGVLGWHLRGIGGRPGLHPRILKTGAGSAAVWVIGLGGLLLGGRGLAVEFGIGGPVALGLVAAVALWVLAGGAGRRALARELEAEVARQRAAYPDLDEEALYRFAAGARYPHLSNRQLEELTADCAGIAVLAARLEPFESARRRLAGPGSG